MPYVLSPVTVCLFRGKVCSFCQSNYGFGVASGLSTHLSLLTSTAEPFGTSLLGQKVKHSGSSLSRMSYALQSFV